MICTLNMLLFGLCACPTGKLKGVVGSEGVMLPGVMVTNGYDCVTTDQNGYYELPFHPNTQYVYVTTPAGYLPQNQGSTPIYYQSIIGGQDTYDFVLVKNSKTDDKHLFFVQADVQLTKKAELKGYEKHLDDMKQYLKDNENGRDAFVLDCGDIVGNVLTLFTPYAKTSEKLGLPFYRAIGNHDMEYGVRSHEHSYSSFEKSFGPIYYSFNRGKAHYIVLNNCFYINRDYRYIGYIDERTLQWIENDLSYVPSDHLVFVVMHIPTSSTKKLEFNALLPDETSNAASLFKLLKGHDSHIITGHSHFNWNVIFNDKLMEHNTAAACGSWWKADICTDGTPAGYGIYEVDGNQLKWLYKGVGLSADHQYRAYPVGSSKQYPDDIIANVWNWDELWDVSWYENGKKMGKMIQFIGYDPLAETVCSDREKMEYDWITPTTTEHLFRATPKNKNAKIEIVVTDRFGHIYRQQVKTQNTL